MLIGLTADLHLDKRLGHRTDADGVNLRSRDLEDAVRQVIDGFIAAKVDVAVIAGDLFDNARPSERSRQFVVAESRRFQAALPEALLVILRGNHDHSGMFLAGTAVGTAGVALPGVAVADGFAPLVVERTGVALTLVPWMRSDAEFLATVEHLEPVAGLHNVLILHAGMADLPEYAELRPGSQTLTRSLVPSDRFDWIFSGHFHGHRMIKDLRWTFIGSPERLSVTEAKEDKGFLTYDTATGAIDRHLITARTWYDIGPIDAATMDGGHIIARIKAERDGLPDWNDALVRIRIRNVAPDVYAALDMAAVRTIGASAFYADIDIRQADLVFVAGQAAPDDEHGGPLLDDLGEEWSRHVLTLTGRTPDEVAAVARIGLAALERGDLDQALDRV